jgi:Divergent InlB B-repeat domain/The GLUG motif
MTPNPLRFLWRSLVMLPVFGCMVQAQIATRPSGRGTATEPYLITTLSELLWISEIVTITDHFRLANDIDASESATWPAGFPPIGKRFRALEGTLDGAGFTIRNLTIRRPDDDGVGLLSEIRVNGVVRNLHLTNAVIIGRDAVAILAGFNAGSISNCTVHGRIEGRRGVGGITGENRDPRRNNLQLQSGLVQQTAANVAITGRYNVGGLVGWNEGVIERSLATGLVEGTLDGSATGGLVGANLHGLIRQSASTAVTSGNKRVGGLVGFYSGNTNGLVQESFASGPVSGSDLVGGLIGHAAPDARTESSYWSLNDSRQSQSATGLPLDAAGMQQPRSFTNWSLGSVWVPPAARAFPRLAWLPAGIHIAVDVRGPGTAQLVSLQPRQMPGSVVDLQASPTAPNAEFLGWLGAGVESPSQTTTKVTADSDKQVVAVFRSIHEIRSTTDLRRIGREPGYELSDRYRLMADLDFTGEQPLEVIAPTDARSFTGVFEGNGHTVRGLQIGSPTNTHAALFGWVGTGAVIRDLRLIDARIEGTSVVGGITARNAGRILRCSVTGQINGLQEVGGIVAINSGTVEDCQAFAVISGRDDVGGIVGTNPKGQLRRVEFNGRVEALPSSHHIGGICGWNDSGIIEDATASGTVTGGHRVGGVIGYLDSTTLVRAHGTNLNVVGRSDTGGIVGSARNSTFTATTIAATVMGRASVGGLVGDAVGSSATGPRISAAVTGTNHVGGLVGYSMESTWGEVDVQGTIAGRSRVGGWAGTLDGGGVLGSRVSAQVNGQFQVGGGVGHSTGVITDAQSEVTVHGFSEVGGLAGVNWAGSIQNARVDGVVRGTDSVGGVAGVHLGTITTSTSAATVEASDLLAGGLVGINRNGSVIRSTSSGPVTSPMAAGGLVGENFAGRLVETAASGEVSGDYRTGGLVGVNYAGQIAESSAAGLVLGGNQAGGLVGENTAGGLIEQSVSTSTVHAISEVGGLVGRNGDPRSGTRIRQSLATGSVVANGADVGGLVGLNETSPAFPFNGPGALVEDSYFLASPGTPPVPHAGTPLTRTQLRQQASFPGWDFIGDWAIHEGRSIPRPAWQSPEISLRVVVEGPGSVTISPAKTAYAAGDVVTLTAIPNDGPCQLRGWSGLDLVNPGVRSVTVTLDAHRTVRAEFNRSHAIRSAEDLARIGRDPDFGLNDHYRLLGNIDASVTRTWNDSGTSTDLLEGFRPIGSEAAPFTGVLDGQGHTIRDLTIARGTEDSVGLIAVAGLGARIRDMRFANVAVEGSATVGLLVGNNWGGSLERLLIAGNVRGQQRVGLVAGIHQAIMKDTVALGIVDGFFRTIVPQDFGGVAGQTLQAIVRDTHFDGSIQATNSLGNVGGITGVSDRSEFTSATSNGSIAGVSPVGGLIGFAENTLLHHGWSTARVSSGFPGPGTGGLIGTSSRTRLRQSAFAGTIASPGLPGGLVGFATGTQLSDSFFSGVIEPTSRGGGLIGEGTDLSLLQCYVNGPIQTTFSAGPFVGSGAPTVTLASVYWNTNTVSPLAIPDANGRSTEALMDPVTYVGWDFTSVWAIDPQRNNGFPYLRGLPYPGLGLPPATVRAGGAPLLEWIAANQGSWTIPDLMAIPSVDVMTAYLLQREPAGGLHQRLNLELQPPEIMADQVRLEASLTFDGEPINSPLQGRWLVETASDPSGPWQRYDVTDTALPPTAGVTPLLLPSGSGNLFRARLEPGLLR